MQIFPKKIEVFDTLLVIGFLLTLIPIRVYFVEYIGDHWLGSFGLLTAIMTTVLILTYKNKLGFFGRSIKRYFMRKSTKKKILILIQFVFAVYMLSSFIYAVNYAEETFDKQKEEIIALLPNEGMETTEKMTNKAIEEIEEDPELLIVALLVMFYTMVFDYDIYALAMWTINEVSDGLYMSLATVLLVEEIEFIGLLIFHHFFRHKLVKNDTT